MEESIFYGGYDSVAWSICLPTLYAHGMYVTENPVPSASFPRETLLTIKNVLRPAMQ